MKNRDMEAPDKAAERGGRALDALRELDGICESDLWGYREGHPTYDKVQKVFALAPKPTGTEAVRGVDALPMMPPTTDREPFTGGPFDGESTERGDYLESNIDWASTNDEAVGWLADNHRVIRASLLSPRQHNAMQRIAERATKLKDRIPLLCGSPDPLDVRDFKEALDVIAALAAAPAPPVSPTPDSTGPAGASEAQDLIRQVDAILCKPPEPVSHPSASWCEEYADWHDAYAQARSRVDALTPSAPIASPVRDDGARERITKWLGERVDAAHRDSEAHPEGSGNRTFYFGQAIAYENALSLIENLPTPASDVPGEAQTQEGGR